MKSRRTPTPRRVGNTKKREQAEAFACQVLALLDGDQEALDLVARLVRVLGSRRLN